jgi:hypothetical protein
LITCCSSNKMAKATNVSHKLVWMLEGLSILD